MHFCSTKSMLGVLAFNKEEQEKGDNWKGFMLLVGREA